MSGPSAGAVGTALDRTAGGLAILVPFGFAAFFSLLQRRFGYPAVMDLPAADVLARTHAAGPAIVGYWAGAMAAAVLLVGLVVLLGRVLDRPADGPWYLGLATTCGVLAAVFTFVDLGQWVFVVPRLAAAWGDPGAADATRAAALVTFDAFHGWVGVGIGIYLATLFSGAWTLLAALAMRRSAAFGPRIGWLGMAAGVVLLASIAQTAGFARWAALNTAGFGLWTVWLLWTGARLLAPARVPG